MAKFLSAMDGTRGKHFLDDKTFQQMIAPPPAPIKPNESGFYVGLGWDQVAVNDKKEFSLFKDGSWFGMRAFMKRQPNGVGWVLLFNASMNPDMYDERTVGDAVHRVRDSLAKHEKFPDVDLFAEFK
jgi:hypothetical protein